MVQTFRLSAAGLQFVVPDASGTFDFIVGQDRYHCPLMNATFLSPKIARLLKGDPTFRECRVLTPDCSHCFEQFLSLGKGSAIAISPDTSLALFGLGEEFENSEVCSLIAAAVSESDSALTVSVAVERLGVQVRLGIAHSREAHFLASRLDECSIDQLRSLSVGGLESILSFEDLSLIGEDWLCSVLMDLGPDFFPLFEFVHFEFVSPTVACQFAERAESCLHSLNLSVWKAISGRFILPVVPSRRAQRPGDVLHFSADASGWLQGIVHFLQGKGCSNFSIRSSSIAGSGFESGRGGPGHAIQLDRPELYFVSEDLPNQWLMLDFEEMRVRVSGYTLRTHVYGIGACHLKSWVLEGSVDAEEWKTLDTKAGNSDLNDKGRMAHFRLSELSGDCRYVRIRSTELNHQNLNYLVVGCFELFGDLINFHEAG
jgi:hypothetical protein